MTFYIQPYPYRRRNARRMAALNGGSRREHFLNVNIRDDEDAFLIHSPEVYWRTGLNSNACPTDPPQAERAGQCQCQCQCQCQFQCQCQ